MPLPPQSQLQQVCRDQVGQFPAEYVESKHNEKQERLIAKIIFFVKLSTSMIFAYYNSLNEMDNLAFLFIKRI